MRQPPGSRSAFRLRAALAALAGLLLAAPASATWSIVFVNHATREVAVASATCLANFDLQAGVPVVWVGAGVGAAQSQLDITGGNRRIIRDGLRDGDTPDEILDELLFGAGTTPGRRQYGIASFSGTSATWTGGQAGLAASGVTGRVGEISYAIQGNVLVGDEVVLAAEEALRNAPGDSGERLLAAMVAAARLGGDGRCSCDNNAPTSCGVPPDGFTKSAHAGFLIVARLGDTNGNCNVNGCALGDYYLELNVIGDVPDPDPVLQLVGLYEGWRRGLAGRPDGVLSRLSVDADRLPADGESLLTVGLRLVDVDGNPLTQGGAAIDVAPADPSAPLLVDVGPVADHGDGSYSFQLRAGTQVGSQELVVSADDGVEKATLHRNLRVVVAAPAALFASHERLALGEAGAVRFTLAEPGRAGAPYLLLASGSGSAPGLALGGSHLPLNADPWLAATLLGSPELQGGRGLLDGAGRAQARWSPSPALLASASGTRLSWAAVSFDGTLRATNVVSLAIGL